MLRKWLALGAALGLIAVATLVPLSGEPASGRSPSWCLACGDFGVADALLNMVLFAPLGCALAYAGARIDRALALIVITTVGVEVLQYTVVRGRTASVSDVLANSLGGALGLVLAGGLRRAAASARHALAGTTVYGAAIVAVMATALALQSVRRPAALHWTERSPVRPRGFVYFTGSVGPVLVDGTPLASGASRAIAAKAPVDIAIAVQSGRPDTRRAEVVQFWTPQGRGWAWADQQDRDVRVHVASVSDAVHLRGHTSWVRGVMPAVPNEPVTVRISVRPFSYRVGVIASDSTVEASTQISPGDGWRLLVPFERQRERWASLLTGLWIAALLAPLAYLARLHSRGTLVGAAAGAGAYLVLLPMLTGCAWLPLAGWCGAATGFAAGAMAANVPAGR